MTIYIITLFPDQFTPILDSSILKRAQNKDLVTFKLINLRDFGEGPHQIVDGRPYGGGVGMVLKAEPLSQALKSISQKKLYTILTSPSGNPYTQEKAKTLSKKTDIVIVCGHYEGFDQRFIDKYIDEEISIGDYVLTGGEIPALAIIDSVVRLIPGVLEKEEATQKESFEGNLLEHPHYTRPTVFEGEEVPEVLLSGNHGEVDEWRKKKSQEKTKKVRPDLLR